MALVRLNHVFNVTGIILLDSYHYSINKDNLHGYCIPEHKYSLITCLLSAESCYVHVYG